MTVFETVLGGVLAAGVGLAVEKYSQHTQAKQEREQWEQRLVRLCKRLIVDTEDGIDNDSIRDCKNAYADIQPLLEEHLSRAPHEPPDEVVKNYEEIAKLKRELGPTLSAIANFDENQVSTTQDHAENIIRFYSDTGFDRGDDDASV